MYDGIGGILQFYDVAKRIHCRGDSVLRPLFWGNIEEKKYVLLQYSAIKRPN
jgi:hypothetical protein